MAGKVVVLTTEQKREIYNFKKKSSHTTYRKIAIFFTCKFNVPSLSHQRIQNICKDKGFENVTRGLKGQRKRNEAKGEFEKELSEIISKKLRTQQMNFVWGAIFR